MENQAKLLRVLKEKNITRVGGSETIEVNVRVIAASIRRTSLYRIISNLGMQSDCWIQGICNKPRGCREKSYFTLFGLTSRPAPGKFTLFYPESGIQIKYITLGNNRIFRPVKNEFSFFKTLSNSCVSNTSWVSSSIAGDNLTLNMYLIIGFIDLKKWSLIPNVLFTNFLISMGSPVTL